MINNIICIKCGSGNLIKAGDSENGKKKYYCKDCGSKFTENADPHKRHNPSEVKYGFELNLPWGVQVEKDTVGICKMCGRVRECSNGKCVECYDNELEEKFKAGVNISINSRLILIGSESLLDDY